jgi:hypothetical protein
MERTVCPDCARAIGTDRRGDGCGSETAARVDLGVWPFRVWTEGDGAAPLQAQTLIVSTGATAKRMDIPGERTYWQRGISACAVCDGTTPRERASEAPDTYAHRLAWTWLCSPVWPLADARMRVR